MPMILFDNRNRINFSPLSLTKAIADFHFGIVSIKERWELELNDKAFVHTDTYLQAIYPSAPEGVYSWIDAGILPTKKVIEQINNLNEGDVLVDEKGIVAGKSSKPFEQFNVTEIFPFFDKIISIENIDRIEFPWQLMLLNDAMIRSDFVLVTKSKKSQQIPSSVQVINSENIFIEEGAKLQFCTLNASTGPIYIGKKAEIMEGSCIRGPFSIGYNSVVKMNSRIYGATTLGPFCMGGGEIKNSIMMGFSNKAHDGYMGDSVIGEWCNFGAGSSNSNLKNSAGDIQIWAMGLNKMIFVGQKCGVIMGDYSRLSINSSVNTGSVIGISCNVFGAGLLPKRIPNFSWGIEGKKYSIEKAVTDINNWKNMKGKEMSVAEIDALKHILQNEF